MVIVFAGQMTVYVKSNIYSNEKGIDISYIIINENT